MSNKISVTEDHIKRGRRNSMRSCPIALAMKDQLLIEECRVGLDFIGIHGAQFSVSRKVEDFITDFDMKRGVKPMTFVIRG